MIDEKHLMADARMNDSHGGYVDNTRDSLHWF